VRDYKQIGEEEPCSKDYSVAPVVFLLTMSVTIFVGNTKLPAQELAQVEKAFVVFFRV
jgi:hypothetical protein